MGNIRPAPLRATWRFCRRLDRHASLRWHWRKDNQIENRPVLKLIADVLVQDADAHARLEAVQALSRSQQDPIVLPQLTTALADSDAIVRRQAVIAIERYGADATSALPAIEELSNSDEEDSQTRELTNEVIETNQPESSALIENTQRMARGSRLSATKITNPRPQVSVTLLLTGC